MRGKMADPIGEARTAVEQSALAMAESASAVAAGSRKKGPSIGPIRYNLEAFGVAILGAVLLKWFCLEAFQIPTSSMQPTLMGSVEAGVYDRLLVDKLAPVFREPQRWDVTVFSYPLQKNQNYVKRLVGLPGETLFIGGGNLYRVTTVNGARHYEVLRKPDRIQREQWREVYPARLHLHEDQKVLGGMLSAVPASAWSDADGPGRLTVQLEPVASRVYRLSFRDDEDGGFVDRVWDGYPTGIAQEIRKLAGGQPAEIVPDARIEATFTPERTIDELTLEVEVRRPDQKPMTFSMLVRGGQCQLVARSEDGRPPAESATKVCELPAGVATTVAFAHVDDELIAWRNGDEFLRVDVSAFDCRSGCELPPRAEGANADHCAVPQLRLKGQGKVQVDGLRICRDLHYTKRGDSFKHAQDLIEIPANHYFMMGDNTLQSIDSRGWTSLRVGVLPDGTVVPPQNAATDPSVQVLRGNKRVIAPTEPPDRDETPVIVTDRDMLAMIDEFGDVHALKARARVVDSNGKRQLFLEPSTSQNGEKEWEPPEEWVPFVPREHIRGRALVIFWRWPFPRLSPIR
jgi:signal peptidase I